MFGTTIDINDNSFEHVLSLLYPKVEYQLSLSEKVKLIEALKEVQLQEEDTSFLSKDFKSILDNSDHLLEDSKFQTKRLDFLNGKSMKYFIIVTLILHSLTH